MYFNEKMLNPQYVNPAYDNQAQMAQYQLWQNAEIVKTVHAVCDMCKSIKAMDELHQQEAFLACFNVMAHEFGWKPMDSHSPYIQEY